MSFSERVQAEALAACERRCCICHKFCGTKMALHHITQKAYGGDDSFENCIPLCLDCHEDMGKADPNHSTGKHYSERELRLHRDNWYERIKNSRKGVKEATTEDIEKLFADDEIILDCGDADINCRNYQNKSRNGTFVFDYSNNNGEYTIGTGEYTFVTKWSKASETSINAYRDSMGANGAIARIKAPEEWPGVIDSSMDFSSRSRTLNIGDVIIWRNSKGKYAATKVISIKDDTRGADHDELTCEYIVFCDTRLSNTTKIEMQNITGGHTVIIDDEKYTAQRIVEEHNKEIERVLNNI